jgi:D-alanyl-D-alanine carboxypeptidase (penicillin-binding protein 5/6)
VAGRAGFAGLFLFWFACAAHAAPAVNAPSWLAMDHDSGAVLAEQRADEVRPAASLTKLMVAYAAFERLRDGTLKLDTPVKVSERAWAAPGERLFLRPGSAVTVEQLLQGMIVRSANDATRALAEHLAGESANFVATMNAAAKRLGLTNTRFADVLGGDAGSVSTARDLAQLTRRLIREFPEYYRWFGRKEFAWGDIRQYNRNTLLWRDDTVDGVKTGQTRAAGWCVVAAAKRGPMRLIAVVLGAKDDTARFDTAQQLLDTGFRRFETRLLYAPEVPAVRVRVWQGDDTALPVGVAEALYLTLPRGQHERLRARVTVGDMLVAPVARGQRVGTLTLELDGKNYAEHPLVALKEIGPGNFLRRAWDRFRLWLQ